MQTGVGFRFRRPASILVAGPSGCRKTTFTKQLILNHLDLFETLPTSISLLLRSLARAIHPPEKTREVRFHERIPETEALKQWFSQRRFVGHG